MTKEGNTRTNQQNPLIFDEDTYNPDTLDLLTDTEARQYWLDCVCDLVVKKFSIQAEQSQRNDPTAKERAQKYQNDYVKIVDSSRGDKCNSEPLSVRTLLQLNEKCLRLNGFDDPWLEAKKLENRISLERLNERLCWLDKFNKETDKWIELFRGILAGNIFDWGAQAVAQILEKDSNFGLNEALERIEPRPWLIDGLDDWLNRIQMKKPHKCAVIFVDNSGVDIVLGVIPFVRELLIRGTKVIISANSEPSLNDVTVHELNAIILQCCNQCEHLKHAVETNQLLVYGNGQKGPCLDMRTISTELIEAIIVNEVDLLIIEGMGRALHTNLNAKFKCETLKLAVIKNTWWANRLGGKNFSIICKYEKCNSENDGGDDDIAICGTGASKNSEQNQTINNKCNANNNNNSNNQNNKNNITTIATTNTTTMTKPSSSNNLR